MVLVETRGLFLGWVPIGLFATGRAASTWARLNLTTTWRVRPVRKWLL